MSTSKDCTGVFGRMFGHAFKSRYESEPPPANLFDPFTRMGHGVVEQMLNAYTKKTYVCDVCKRCGEVKERAAK